jgi:hypothetical protein
METEEGKPENGKSKSRIAPQKFKSWGKIPNNLKALSH